MTWQAVALISTLALLAVTAYAVWSLSSLERAKGQRDSLRLEMEAGAVKTFAGAIEAMQNEVKNLRLRVNSGKL